MTTTIAWVMAVALALGFLIAILVGAYYLARYWESGNRRSAAFLAGGLLIVVALTMFAAYDWEGDTAVVRVENDLNTPVRLRVCRSNDCDDGFHPLDETLPPGKDTIFNVAAEGIAHVYLVESPDEEQRYGCLPFVAPRWKPEIAVRVSEHVPCREDVDEDRFWPTRWANAVDSS